jgi:hypothetical protein
VNHKAVKSSAVAGLALLGSLSCSPPPSRGPSVPTITETPSLVSIDSIWRDSTWLAIAYHVRLDSSWTGEMEALLLRPGVSVASLVPEAPARWMGRRVTYDGIDAIEWVQLHGPDRLRAEQDLGEFIVHGAVAIGDVTVLVEPYSAPELTSEDQLGDPPPLVPVWERGRLLTTQGPVPSVAGDAAGRAAQIETDLSGWCGSNSQPPHEVCQSLLGSARTVRNALAQSDPEAIEGAVRALRTELEAQRGVHLPSANYWRLVADLLMIEP